MAIKLMNKFKAIVLMLVFFKYSYVSPYKCTKVHIYALQKIKSNTKFWRFKISCQVWQKYEAIYRAPDLKYPVKFGENM